MLESEKKKRRCDDRAQCIGEHVLLCVPNVSLASQICRTCGRIAPRCIDPLDDLVAHGDRCDHENGVGTKEKFIRNETLRGKPLGDGIRIETDGEMRDAVVVIALESEEVRHPVERHFLKREMSADCMEKDEHAHKRVGGIRKTDAADIENSDHSDDDPDREILGEPRHAVDGADREKCKDDKIASEEYHGEFAVIGEFHVDDR